MEPEAPRLARAKSTPRAVVAYLKAVRALVGRANDSRQTWIRHLGVLMRSADPSAPGEATRIGQEQGQQFRQIRVELDALALPPVCDGCQMSLRSWLDKHIAACDVMVEVGQSGEMPRLRATQGLLAEARIDLQRFNYDSEALVTVIRRRAEAARARRAARRIGSRWPFGGAESPARAN
jgi:hypothetical protein